MKKALFINCLLLLLLIACHQKTISKDMGGQQTAEAIVDKNDAGIVNENKADKQQNMDTPTTDVKTKTIYYQAGNPDFEGQTTVVVNETGLAKVGFKRGEEEKAYEQQLSEEQLSKFWKKINKYHPCDLSIKEKTPVPGEVEVTLELTGSDKDCKRTFWNGVRYDNKSVNKLMTLFANIAKEVSKGEVEY